MFNKKEYQDKMNKTFDKFLKDLGTLSTGRAKSNMLDLISVDVYGQKMPINQLASITTPEPRVINIQVWDNSNVALIDSDLGGKIDHTTLPSAFNSIPTTDRWDGTTLTVVP